MTTYPTIEDAYRLIRIGTVHQKTSGADIFIYEPYREALQQLEHFSHLIVLWWAHKRDNPESRAILSTEPPYAQGHLTGVFATRAEYRPNPIALTTCKLLDVDQKAGILQVAQIDAMDGSPILDLKAYFPVCDRVREASIPAWLSDWPEWMPDDGLGL